MIERIRILMIYCFMVTTSRQIFHPENPKVVISCKKIMAKGRVFLKSLNHAILLLLKVVCVIFFFKFKFYLLLFLQVLEKDFRVQMVRVNDKQQYFGFFIF